MYKIVHVCTKLLLFSLNRQDDFPDSHRLDLTLLKFRYQNEVILGHRSFTALSLSEDRPCNDDPDYRFSKCIELEYSRRL